MNVYNLELVGGKIAAYQDLNKQAQLNFNVQAFHVHYETDKTHTHGIGTSRLCIEIQLLCINL